MKSASVILLIALLISVPILLLGFVQNSIEERINKEPFSFGVACGSDTTKDAKLLIDKIKELAIIGAVRGQVAFVLPEDYGWGMGRTQHITEERIWGFWTEDEYGHIVWENMNTLMRKYGLRLDIVYDDLQLDFEEK